MKKNAFANVTGGRSLAGNAPAKPVKTPQSYPKHGRARRL
jgi:hypothetical protein